MVKDYKAGGGICLTRRTGEIVVVTDRESGRQLTVRVTHADRGKARILFVGDDFEVNREEIQIAKDAARKPG